MESISSGEGNRIQAKIPKEYHDFIAGAVGGSLRLVFKLMRSFDPLIGRQIMIRDWFTESYQKRCHVSSYRYN